MSLAAGSRIGSYEIKSLLGAGGMGQVWRAHDTRLERDVALKVLPGETLGDDTARARLVREARLASKLNHPHICTVYDVGEADPSTGSGQAVTYIAMELVEGQALSARVAEGPLPVEQILRYGQQMADALAHAHGRGVVHRDFKSANVVVTPDGQVKVLDFGLAKRLSDEQLADVTTVSRHSLTAPGVVAGTLAYMAPEQLQGQPADARSDVWALGVVLYELASGKRPFQGQTGFDLTAAILRQPLPALPSSVPAPLAGVINRCLAKEPEERYQQASEARAALDAVASGQAAATWATWRVMLRRRRGLVATVGSVVALLVVAAIVFALDVGGLRSRVVGGGAGPVRVIKLAVLPFANLSGNPDQEYLSDGLTQEMIAQLGRLHPEALSVIARTSVMQYKMTNTPISQIGRELKVDYVLEGSAQREAARIRITTELIKVADQAQLWAESYERDLSGILALQGDVARSVARALALKLLPAEQARLAGARTVDPEVYDLCLKGSSYADRLTAADLDTAEQYFQRALAKDPNSAVAYAWMSSVWARRQQMGIVPSRVAGPKAKAAALKAAELDDTLAVAHRQLAGVAAYTDWDWATAERECKRAIELDPSNAVGYSHLLMILRRPDEAMQQIARAIELDPLSVGTVSFYAIDLLCARRYDDAIGQARKALRMQPDHPVAIGALYQALFALRKYDDMAAMDRQGAAGDPELKRAFEHGFAEGGYPGSQKRWADVWAARYGKAPGLAPTDIATVYVFGGDYSRAFDWLEKAYDDRDPNLPYISCQPVWDPLRSHPRFQSLLRRMGLPQ